MPTDFRVDLTKILVQFVIPKFHLPAHVPSCHAPFSFNYCVGVSRTDGEGVERDWAAINPVSMSTREMTPGHCQDTLNDHWGDWNWKKVMGMGKALARKIRAAIPERIKHAEYFQAMCESLSPLCVEEWSAAVKTWEAEAAVRLPRDVEANNPYELKTKELTQPQVRLALAQDDAAHGDAGRVTMHKVSPSQFVVTGLDLQEHQHRIIEEQKDLMNGTPTQRATLQERRNILRRKIDAWVTIQVVYMPGVAQMRINSDRRIALLPKVRPFINEPEEAQLFLPSEFPSNDFSSLVSAELRQTERRIREAQGHDALQQIRHYLRLLAYLWKGKNQNARGQRENTRAATLIKRTEGKKQSAVRKYRRVWKALNALDPIGSWATSLKELNDADVRGMTDHDQSGNGKVSEGRKVLSWIWASPGIGTGLEAEDVGLHDSLRVEWCKSRARAQRWTEEIRLVRAEMQQVVLWLKWRERWWRDLGGSRKHASLEAQEAAFAYASHQAELQVALRESFQAMWRKADMWADTEITAAEGGKKKD